MTQKTITSTQLDMPSIAAYLGANPVPGIVSSVAVSSTDLTVTGSPITTSGTINLTLTNVNTNIGTFNNLTVNAKGQVTAATNVAYLTAVTLGQVTTALGYVPVNPAAATNFTGTLTFDGVHKITGLPMPIGSTDAASKAYVDAAVASIDIHPACVVATTSNLSATYANGTAGVGATLTANPSAALPSIDSITLSLNARILVKNQTIQIQNGIYVVTQITSPWILTRSTDYDNSVAAEVHAGNYTFIQQGTINASTSWVETVIGTGPSGSIIIGTNNISFTQFSGAGSYLAGTGLLLTGNTFSNAGALSFNARTGNVLPALGDYTFSQISGSATATQLPALAATGDVTGTGIAGTGNIPLTLASVNANVGSFTSASITVDAKGRITAASNGSGVITSISGTAGQIVSSGGTTPVLSLATAGVASTYTSITTDAYGRVISGTNPGFITTNQNITLAGDITGSGTTSIAGTLATVNSSPGTFTNATITVNAKGLVTVASGGSAAVTSVLAGAGISVSGTTTPTVTNTGVTSLTGTSGQISVSTSTGAVTLSLPSTISVNTSGTASNITGILAITNGGTGQTTAAAAFNVLVPTQAGNSGKFLTTDGSLTSWGTIPSTSVGAAGSPTQVQFNNGGLLAADADFAWDSTNNIMTLGSTATPASIIAPSHSLIATTGVAINIKGGATTGNNSPGGPVNITGGLPTQGIGGAVNVTGGNGVGSTNSGGDVNVTGGNGVVSGSSSAGNVNITGGQGGPTSLAGGNAIISGGPGGTTSGTGGTAFLLGGVATQSGNGGGVRIQSRSGAGPGNFSGGGILVTAGNGTGTGTGGSIIVQSGDAAVSGTAGPINIIAGVVSGSGTPGAINITGTTTIKSSSTSTASTLLLSGLVAGIITNNVTRFQIDGNGTWLLGTSGVSGTTGQLLTSQGAGAEPIWTSAPTGSVTSVNASGGTTGLTFTGGPVTTTGTLTLAGTLAIANGGTGQTTANAAFNALAPSQTSNSGKFLTTDGTNTSWATATAGSVTSVNASGGTTGLSFTGGPVTTTGTLTLTGTLAAVNGGTGQSSFVVGDLVYASTTTALSKLAAGTSGNVLTSNGAGVAPSWQPVPGGGGGSADVQIFTTSGTWTKPSGAKSVHVVMVGGGSGGGSGRRGAVSTDRVGGCGGAGGGYNEKILPASILGATETITVGVGSAGAAGQTTNDTNGNDATAGTASTFGSWLRAGGGSGGLGGLNSTVTGNNSQNGGSGMYTGFTNSSWNAGQATIGQTNIGGAMIFAGIGTGPVGGFAAGGGGGGGFVSSSNSATGGTNGLLGSPIRTSGGLAAGVAGTSSSNATAGTSATTNEPSGGGGGGGGFPDGTSHANGANGGLYGGGGGGGAPSTNGTTSGSGGNGGNGIIIVTTYF